MYKIFKIIKQQQEQRARRLLKGEGHNPVVPLLCFARRVSNNRSFCPLYGYQTFLSRLNCYELILDTFYCEYVDLKKKIVHNIMVTVFEKNNVFFKKIL